MVAWKEVKNIILNMGTFQNESLTGKKDEPNPGCTERVVSQSTGPFLKSTWYQFNGYNDALKYISCDGGNKHVYAGCVPISMAQIMRYYQRPSNYNWSDMPMNNATSTTANFILDIHNAIGSMYPGQPVYSCTGSGVGPEISMVLKSKFGYTSAQFANYNFQVVKEELNAGRPVILQGADANTYTAHMWICDGYSTLQYYFEDCTGASASYLNMNWGFEDGKNNGYYAYDNFNPGKANYSEAIKMTYNIKP